jgi:hypothetical protein
VAAQRRAHQPRANLYSLEALQLCQIGSHTAQLVSVGCMRRLCENSGT